MEKRVSDIAVKALGKHFIRVAPHDVFDGLAIAVHHNQEMRWFMVSAKELADNTDEQLSNLIGVRYRMLGRQLSNAPMQTR